MKKETTVIMVLGLGMMVFCGAGKKADSVVAPVPTTTVVETPAPAVLVETAGEAAALTPAAEQLSAAQESIGDMTADFTLMIAGAGKDGTDFTAQGKMWVATGRRYVVVYEQPEKQKLVSNGKKRWLYLEKINQVQVQSLPPAGNPNEFFLELGGGLPKLIQQCQVRKLEQDSKHPEWDGFELVPSKGKDLGFEKVAIWFAGKQRIPQRIFVTSMRVVRVDFSNVKIHDMETLVREPEKGLDPALFNFEVPQGAEVIDMF